MTEVEKLYEELDLRPGERLQSAETGETAVIFGVEGDVVTLVVLNSKELIKVKRSQLVRKRP